MRALYAKGPEGLSWEEMGRELCAFADERGPMKKVLLLPPDHTRFHSGAGRLTNLLWHHLKDRCEVDILPALGTHVPLTEAEMDEMFGDVPHDRFLVHNWRTDVVRIGTVPASFVSEVSEGVWTQEIPVEVNRRVVEGGYDWILSLGQVVPHEVVGMANYSKNLFVGCGGAGMISASHAMGAFYGLERMMGRDHSPVRRVFDYAQERFLSRLPLDYALTVTVGFAVQGLFLGGGRAGFEKAVALSQEKNLNLVEPLKKVVVYLDPGEFKSTWLGNKAVYRTRMAIADGGELVVLAPGVETFGEDPDNDVLIRRYGYCGSQKVIDMCKTHDDLKANLSAAAHLIQGSTDGRFTITYCTKLVSKEEIESVCFNYMPYDEAVKRYDPKALKPGYNTMPDGEEIYFVPNPALGLWAYKNNF